MIETFNKAKDWMLTATLVFIAGIAIDIRNTVTEMAADNILIKYQISIMRDDIRDSQKKDSEQDKEIVEIRAIIKDNDYTVQHEEKEPK